MVEKIRGLSNADYHFGEKYKNYISSSQLKHYLKSPKAFKYQMEHPEEERNDNLEFGSLFHSGMEAVVSSLKNQEKDLSSIDRWVESLAVFEPPVNEKTRLPYGSTSKAYSEAYANFLVENQGKTVATSSARDQAEAMIRSLFDKCGETSMQVRKLAKWAKEIETSYFYETEEGIGLKVRPDLLTNGKLVDWKTCSLESLDEDSIVRQIVKYRYDISLAMYQWVLHEITGKWYGPYLVFVSKTEPFDSIMVNMSHWCYKEDKETEYVSMGVGALEFKRLLNLHTECVKKGEWPGIECLLKEDGNVKILKPDIPIYLGRKYYGEDWINYE